VAGRRLHRVGLHLSQVRRIDPDGPHVRDRAAASLRSNGARMSSTASCSRLHASSSAVSHPRFGLATENHTAVRLESRNARAQFFARTPRLGVVPYRPLGRPPCPRKDRLIPVIVQLDALRPRSPITGMLLGRSRAHVESGPPLELRDDQCVPRFVGSDTGSDQSERRVSAALDAAAELGIRWGDNMAVETRCTARGWDPDVTQTVVKGAEPRIFSP
jgi:hypothetical protein